MAYEKRVYTGGAVPSYVGVACDNNTTSITLQGPLIGWDNLVGGSRFTVVLDYGTSTEEKILCNGVNISTGALTVLTRGYDDTNPVGHSVNPVSSGNCFPVFSAVEAKEANTAVVSISQIADNTGTSVTPADISLTASSAGSSKYAAAYDHAHKFDSTTLNNLLGRAYISVTRNTTWSISGATGTGTALTWNSVQFAGQGITSGALDTSTGYITVPIAGIWRVSGAVQFQNGNGNSGILLQTVSGATRTTVASGSLVPDASANKGSVVSTLLSLTAGQVVCAALVSTGGTPATAYSYDATRHYLTLEFVSVA